MFGTREVNRAQREKFTKEAVAQRGTSEVLENWVEQSCGKNCEESVCHWRERLWDTISRLPRKSPQSEGAILLSVTLAAHTAQKGLLENQKMILPHCSFDYLKILQDSRGVYEVW